MPALNERGRWCALVTAVACALLLPGLGSVGSWYPQEFDAAGDSWSARIGLGAGELGARLPRALAGVAAALVAFAWASRVAGARVGAVAGILVAASPVVLASSRQLTGAGDVELVLGQGLIVAGAAVMAWPRGWPSFALGGASVAIGGALSHVWGGAVLGLAVPAAAVAVAAWATRRRRLAATAAVAAALAAVLGLAGVASLGPSWAGASRELAWSAGLEGIAYGMFPWSALLPVALARGALSGDRPRVFASALAVAWTVASVIACSVLGLGVGPARFSALSGAAVLVALWLDDAAGGRCRPAPGAIALCALIALVLARDLVAFPDRLASLAFADHVTGVIAGRGARAVPAVAGALFVAALVLLARTNHRRVARGAAAAAVAACAIGAALHTSVWTPAVSRNLSARHLFDRYHAVAAPGQPLAVLSLPARVSDRYAPDARRAGRAGEVVALLAAEERAFAIVSRRALCEVTQETRARGGAVHVLDQSDVAALVSNQRRSGEPRATGLEEEISGRAPRPDRSLDAVLADGVDILGVDMPTRVRRGASFEMTLHYQVRTPPTRPWKVFVHFDGPGGVRFQGDHDPIGGRCPPVRWKTGDFVTDRFTVKAGSLAQPRGRYRVWVGFFVGSHPHWTNMKVLSGDADPHDRVAAGFLEVR